MLREDNCQNLTKFAHQQPKLDLHNILGKSIDIY